MTQAAREFAFSNADPALCRVGVLADTHIPDRVDSLHPAILPRLQAAAVDHILHAGDISCARVLDALRAVAPVTAVRGNRDMLAGRLAMVEHIPLGGVEFALMHGHHGLIPYLWDKLKFWRFGYQLERYLGRLVREAGAARVVVYGHTHYPEIILRDGKMIFNPGSASFGTRTYPLPCMGLITIYASGRIAAKITPLEGYKLVHGKWQKK